LALFQPHLRAAMPVAELRAMGTLLTSSFAHVYWVSAGIMALATVAACAIRELPLRGK
jgi:hypothetical protein